MSIHRYLNDHSGFDVQSLGGACKALHINGEIQHREVIAARIIDLARNGVIDAKALSERVVAETKAMRSL
jgi:hypothetical protein